MRLRFNLRSSAVVLLAAVSTPWVAACDSDSSSPPPASPLDLDGSPEGFDASVDGAVPRDAAASVGPDATLDGAGASDAAATIDSEPNQHDAAIEGTPSSDAATPDAALNDAAQSADASTSADAGLGPIDAGPNRDAACSTIGFNDDAQNCGYCGNSCGLQAACTVGRCTTVLAMGASSPEGLAIGANAVYFASDDSNVIYSVPLAGGTPAPLVSPPPITPPYSSGGKYVTLLGGTAYFTAATADNMDVFFAPVGGTDAGVGIVSNTELYPQYIANDGTSVFWTDGTSSNQSRIRRFDTDGGVATLPITSDAGSPFQSFQGGIAVDATYVYWTQYTATNGQVMRANKTDGTGVTMLNTVPIGSVVGMTLDATTIYLGTLTAAGSNVPGLYSMPLGGGAPVALSIAVTPSEMVNDATSVYFVDGNSIRKIDKAAGSPVVTLAQFTTYLRTAQGAAIYESAANYSHLAIDDNYVYWFDIGQSSNTPLLRTAKAL